MSEQKRERWERDGRAPGYASHQRNANVQDPMEMDQADFGNNFFNEEDETPVDMEMIKEKIKLVPLSDMDFSEPPDDVMDVDCSMREDILAPLRLTLPEHANFEGSPKQDIRAQHADYSQMETLGEGIVLKQVKTEITEIGMEVGDATATAAKVAAEVAADVITGGVVAEAGPRPDFSSWTVEDDILLKNAMEVGAAMEALAKGAVKFSQRYSVRELRERWRALLYDPVVSEEAALRMLKSEALATNPGKLSNLNRLKYPQVSNRKRKLKSVRAHYYKMRIKITAENNPNHSAANLDNEAVESLPDIAPKEPEPRMEESTFSQMVRLFAAGGVGAVVQAIPSVAVGKVLQEDSSFISILPQEDTQAQTSEVIVGLEFSRQQGVERSKSLQELDTLTAEHMMEPPNLNNPNSLVAAQTHLDSGGPVKSSVDSAVELSARNDATQKHSVEELRTCADQRFKDSELDSSQIKPPPCILEKVVDKRAHATEPLDSQRCASEVKETCAIDGVSSTDKPLIVDVPGPEHMICVLNTEDTDIPSPPPGSATHLPSLFSPMYLSSEMKGDENESGISGGGYEGTDDFEISEHEFVPLVSEDKRNIVRVDQVVKLEPTSKGLENDARYTMITQGLLSTAHSASADVAAQTNDKEDMDPPESAAVHVSKSLLLTPQGAASANDISAAADQSKSHSEVPGFTKELALPSQAGVPGQMEQGLCCTDQTVDVPATTKSAGACQDYEDGLESDEEMPSFSDVESMILDMDLDPAFDEDALARAESRRMYRRHRKTLMRLEQGANAALERTMTLQGAIAVLYGHHLRYFITRNEVLLGRVTADIIVDIDLGKEGRANKVSRRQATIKLKEDGVFYLKNLGRRDLSVNNIPIANGQHASLGSNCLIEVGGMRFIFEINKKLVRQRVVDMLYSRQHG